MGHLRKAIFLWFFVSSMTCNRGEGIVSNRGRGGELLLTFFPHFVGRGVLRGASISRCGEVFLSLFSFLSGGGEH